MASWLLGEETAGHRGTKRLSQVSSSVVGDEAGDAAKTE
jgi:hypothetical protein